MAPFSNPAAPPTVVLNYQSTAGSKLPNATTAAGDGGRGQPAKTAADCLYFVGSARCFERHGDHLGCHHFRSTGLLLGRDRQCPGDPLRPAGLLLGHDNQHLGNQFRLAGLLFGRDHLGRRRLRPASLLLGLGPARGRRPARASSRASSPPGRGGVRGGVWGGARAGTCSRHVSQAPAVARSRARVRRRRARLWSRKNRKNLLSGRNGRRR